jgi:hypothetical protein
MSVERYTSMATRHWLQFLPEKTADLQEAGTFEFRVKQAVERAMAEIQLLMRHGLQQHEAEEIVLPEYITLPPETGA